MAASEETQGTWVKSNMSAETNCGEVRANPDGTVSFRDSDDPTTVVQMSGPSWAAFVGGVKDGQFDELPD
jgi:hypothetical protein